MKKKLTLIFVLVLFSCSNDQNNSPNSNDETQLDLVTGIFARQSANSPPTVLGNPNVLISEFVMYPNPSIDFLFVESQDNSTISDIWFVRANADKIFQDTDFGTILNSNLYAESDIELNSQLQLRDLDVSNSTINLENLGSGYYRVFVKIDNRIMWDNIYIDRGNQAFEDLIDFWD